MDRSSVSRCRDFKNAGSIFVDFTATVSRAADATLVVGMQGCFVVDRDFFPRLNVSQGEEEDVVVDYLHEGVWNTGMVDVMRTISAATSVKTPPIIDFTNAQHLSM